MKMFNHHWRVFSDGFFFSFKGICVEKKSQNRYRIVIEIC